MENHDQKEKVDKSGKPSFCGQNQVFLGKTKYFLRALPFSPSAVSATWLHVGAPQKIQEKWA
jgi:hypothetical protein